MVRHCLNYTINDKINPCNGNYAQCAKSIKCPDETAHCFGVFNITENNQLSFVISAGCTPHVEMPESCKTECYGQNRARFYYCCCNENNCNERLIIPKAPVAPQTHANSINNLNLNLNFTNDSTLTVPSDTNWFAIIALVLLATSLISAFVIRRRRLIKKQSNHSDLENALQSNHACSNDGGHGSKTNQAGELNELRSIPDVALMLPIRNILGQNLNYHNSMTNNDQQNNTNDNNQALETSTTNPNRVSNSHDINRQTYIRVDLKHIKLLEIIGSGRFGTVHKATVSMPRHVTDENDCNSQDDNQVEHKDDDEVYEIAIKVTSSSEYQSWQNELKIYSSFKTRHPNILSFLGSCQHVRDSSYWLLVEYASKGSLHHYLKENIISWHEFLSISLGIAHGLSHLHDADIAHRDFKSKNVLLKHDLTPCITDFGVASMLDVTSGSHTEQRKKYLQVGTPRYMAPEVLECSVTFTKISFTKIDVYALSLVLWELLSRCFPLPWPQQYENDESLTTYTGGVEDQPLLLPPPLYQETHSDQNSTQKNAHKADCGDGLDQLEEQSNMTSPRDVVDGLTHEGTETISPITFGTRGDGENNETESTKLLRTNGQDAPPTTTGVQAKARLPPGSPPYKLPFEDVVGSNPDISTMRQIVINEKLRPPLRPEWHYYPVSKLCQAIIDGWEYDHDARISGSCFVERIESLQQQLQQQQLQQQFQRQRQQPPQPQPRSRPVV